MRLDIFYVCVFSINIFLFFSFLFKTRESFSHKICLLLKYINDTDINVYILLFRLHDQIFVAFLSGAK